MTTALLQIYGGPVTVWCEDELTAQALTDLWQDPDIRIFAAVGEASVRTLVNSAPRSVRNRVFGVVDSDFGGDNEADWSNPNLRVFKPRGHEVENLFLDFDAMAAISGSWPAAQIEQEARSRAMQLIWWMSCKQTLREILTAIALPHDPPQPAGNAQGVYDLASAVQHIVGQGYIGALGQHAANWTPAAVRNRIATIEGLFRTDLQTDNWKYSFSGKEILRHLRSHVPGLDGVARDRSQSAAERDIDLGMKIAAQLRSRVPQSLSALKAILRARAGLP